jgi:hypothetical protein
VFWRGGTYLRRMSIFGKSKSQQGGSVVGVKRLTRFVGRMLLWGCVLLLLIRGVASYLSTGSHVVTTTRGAGVTVTQPASVVGRK